MKSLLVVLCLAVSGNVFANSIAQTVSSPLMSSAATTLGMAEKQAALVLNDAQEFMLTGSASSFLSQKIKETQELNLDSSESEALSILINDAETILSK